MMQLEMRLCIHSYKSNQTNKKQASQDLFCKTACRAIKSGTSHRQAQTGSPLSGTSTEQPQTHAPQEADSHNMLES